MIEFSQRFPAFQAPASLAKALGRSRSSIDRYCRHPSKPICAQLSRRLWQLAAIAARASSTFGSAAEAQAW